MPFRFDNQYSQLPEQFYARQSPVPVENPAWVAFNEALATDLGLEATEFQSPELLQVFAGNRLPEGATPVAAAYAGHQFGGFVPRLGDGRAILLGEVVAANGRRYDLQLKGSGRTPFSRGGDGRAALGPVIREFLVSEAMFALGVPTTRSLAAVATGEIVYRERPLPGAVLTRVASSHVRVGTFQYFAARRDRTALVSLVNFALSRHYPEHAASDTPALALFDAVMNAQVNLVAKWLSLGFVHGVMNTDNCAVSGETIDYGPCAFLDTYDPERTFSSIDELGRYAFDQQHKMVAWNLARFAESLLPLIADGGEQAVELLEARMAQFPAVFEQAYGREMGRKLGLTRAELGDSELLRSLLDLMAKASADFTGTFRALAQVPSRGSGGFVEQLGSQSRAAEAWLGRWQERVRHEEQASGVSPEALMSSANPRFIPRNHRVEEAISAATDGDLGPFQRLRRVLARPFEEQSEESELATPPGDEQRDYRTFCGT
jgi:serine/tyrosine/threonine adenylyltransferase